jgi:predicted RNA-binding protein
LREANSFSKAVFVVIMKMAMIMDIVLSMDLFFKGSIRERGYKMCEANAYLKAGESETLFMEAVDVIEPYGDGLKLVDIYGKQLFVQATIKNMNLLNHRIILEQVPVRTE